MSDLAAFLAARLDDDEAAAQSPEAATASAWYDAPLPPRFHRCRPVQSVRISTGAFYERCACGAARRNARPVAGAQQQEELVSDRIGLDPDYSRLLDAQDGKCAECKMPSDRFVFDVPAGKLYCADCHRYITAREVEHNIRGRRNR